jgi:DNA-binding transcriptional regulator YhcF (GntR family)
MPLNVYTIIVLFVPYRVIRYDIWKGPGPRQAARGWNREGLLTPANLVLGDIAVVIELKRHLEQNTVGPLADRLAQGLIVLIRSGRLPPGRRLPPELEMARDLSMSRNTVRRALKQLQDLGFVRRHRRRGTFVTDWLPRVDDATNAPLETSAVGLLSPRRVVSLGIAPAYESQRRAWREIVDRFEARNLDCRIELLPQHEQMSLERDDVRAEQLADVYPAVASELVDLDRMGLTQNWDPLQWSEHENPTAELFDWALAACESEGLLLGLPIASHGFVRLTNVALLEELGLDRFGPAADVAQELAELHGASVALAKRRRRDAWATTFGGPGEHAPAFGVSFGGFLDRPLDYDTPAWQATLERLARLASDLPWAFPFVDATAGPPPGYTHFFIDGRIASHVWHTMNVAPAEDAGLDLMLSPMPATAEARPIRFVIAMVVNPAAGDVALARELALFLVGAEAQNIFARTGVCIPTHRAAAHGSEFLNGPRGSRHPMLDAVTGAHDCFGAGQRRQRQAWPEFLWQAINPVLFSLVMGERNIAETTAQLRRRHEAYLKQLQDR